MARPDPSVVAGAQRYSRSQSGIHLPDIDYSQVAIAQRASRAIGHAYDALPEHDPKAMPAYDAMRQETMRQFDHMTKSRSKGGMGIDVEVTKEDPYGKGGANDIHRELHADVRDNSRVKVLSTKTTGGHPVFSNDENDAFRAVHDVFGHLGSGRGVDMHGEEAAYQKHSRMFSGLARQAMTSETRGQNSAMHLQGDFPKQKTALLPGYMQSLQFNRAAPSGELRAASADAAHEDRKQGLR